MLGGCLRPFGQPSFLEQIGGFARFASGPPCPGGLSFRMPNLRAVFSSWAALFLFWNELASCGVHSTPLHHHEAASNVRTNLIGAALRICRAALFCALQRRFVNPSNGLHRKIGPFQKVDRVGSPYMASAGGGLRSDRRRNKYAAWLLRQKSLNRSAHRECRAFGAFCNDQKW